MIMRMLFTIFVFSCLVLPVPALCQDNGQDNEEKAAGGITLRDCIENLTLEGDLLIRYERRELDVPDGDDKNLDRIRTRFRLGFVWKSLDESWEVGAGLATGGPEATSTQDTWSEEEFFETGDIRLDYAYASHSLGALTFVAGQQKNPFETSWLLWDSDVRPAGFTLQFEPGMFFVTLGGYDVIQLEEEFGILYAAQLGTKIELDEIGVTLAAAYYDFDRDFEREYVREHDTLDPDYEFNVVDLYAEAEMDLGDIGLTVYGQVFKNFGAEGDAGQSVLGGDLDPEDENVGWVAGVEAEFMKFVLEYSYAQIGADAFVGELTDATFGSGVGDTDLKGHIISLDYNVTKCFTIGGNVYIYEAWKRDNEPDAVLYHADVVYKF
ncbi:MAG TPA: putative porin [Deltaproteobacteria bacterium]|jgi:hypothetical protein|nr:putative porin [Deltaproteobacteria bacterium]MDI9543884.1 putative porin [Pseudomonadota bacterium]HNR51826.1 putative porin [Deltaproteobacteria bacterium]HOD71641.1 putative porin [Deltaproteobacteria bacterium]HOE74062.1 putative porin [Deltaproteobacteria bacterium]